MIPMSELTPRARLVTLLTLLLGCALLGGRLWLFVDWAAIARSERELAQNEARIEQAETFVRRTPAMDSQCRQLARQLRTELQSFIAPADEPFPWASQYITLHATRLGLDIRVLTPLSVRIAPWEGLAADDRQLKLFAVRLDVVASYEDTMKLVGRMENANPLMTLTSMTVIDTGRDAGLSRVTMVWEWPMWRRTPESRQLQDLLKSAA